MKLLFFTPAVAHSAIGRMAMMVIAELANEGHSVSVVRTERARYHGQPIHQFGVDVLRWNDRDQVRVAIENADAVVHQVGNNFELHVGSLEWLAKEGGVVCLHDYFLGHLFWGWSEGRRDEAHGLLRAWYGDEIAQRYYSADHPSGFIAGTHEAAPMTEWVAAMADAVIAHSGWAISRAASACAGPVRVVPLPYDIRTAAEKRADRKPKQKFTVLTFGDINENKRAESVIRAIAASEVLSGNVAYRLVGRIAPGMRDHLSGLAAKLNVPLEITGQVDDATLYSAIDQADAISCLRTPVLESASASAIEAMLSGKPIVVSNAGFYSEIPDRCALKISPHNEQVELQRALELLYVDDGPRLKLAFEAAKWAALTFSSKRYAKALLDVCSDAAKTAPVCRAMRNLVELGRRWDPDVLAMLSPQAMKPLSLFEYRSKPIKDPSAPRHRRDYDLRDLPSPIVFIHIPKTAGISFTNYLRINIAKRELIANPFYKDYSEIDAQSPSLKLYYGHFRFCDIFPLRGMALYATFLRDPLARVVSQYSSWHDPKNLSEAWIDAVSADEVAAVRFTQNASLEEFVCSDNPLIIEQLRDVQTRFLCDEPDVEGDLQSAKVNLAQKFDYYGIVERFDDSIALFRRRFRNSVPYTLARSHENRSAQTKTELSGAALARVRKLNQKDYELYEFALHRFEGLIAELG